MDEVVWGRVTGFTYTEESDTKRGRESEKKREREREIDR